MRVTDYITNDMSKKSGLPLYMNNVEGANKNRLIDALDKKKVEDDFEDLSSIDVKKSKELQNTSKDMIDIADIFDTDGKETAIYEDARKNGDLSGIIKKVDSFATKYNNLLQSLEGDNGELFNFYRDELKNCSTDVRDALKNIGIEFSKKGFMAVDENMLENIDIDEFKNCMDVFSHKVGFLAGRIGQNANATEESLSNRYDALGNMFSQSGSRYDFWG